MPNLKKNIRTLSKHTQLLAININRAEGPAYQFQANGLFLERAKAIGEKYKRPALN